MFKIIMQSKALPFILSSLGIILSFILVSVLTERRFKLSYDGKKFTYTCTMNVVYFFIVVVSAVIAKIVRGKKHFGHMFNRDLV